MSGHYAVRECARCGGLYVPHRGPQRFCSSRCFGTSLVKGPAIPVDRVHSAVTVTEAGCWEMPRTRGHRYAQMKVNGRRWPVHRFMYRISKGPIPEGMLACHSCDNTWCVNPAHLWLGTHTDNMRDMAAKGRAGKRGQMERCRIGHILSGRNLYVTSGGLRQCVACWAERERRYHESGLRRLVA